MPTHKLKGKPPCPECGSKQVRIFEKPIESIMVIECGKCSEVWDQPLSDLEQYKK